MGWQYRYAWKCVGNVFYILNYACDTIYSTVCVSLFCNDAMSQKYWTLTTYWHNLITTSRFGMIFGKEDHEAIAY